MVRGRDRADDEEQQGHQHPRIAAPHGEQRARGTAAAQLHADAEDEGTEHHRHASRRNQAGDRGAEQATGRQCREEQQHGQGQHDHLRTQAGATAFVDEYTPGRGEAESGVIKRQAQGSADHQQQHMLEAGVEIEEPGAGQQQGQGDQGRTEAARFGCGGCGKTHWSTRITVKRAASIPCECFVLPALAPSRASPLPLILHRP